MANDKLISVIVPVYKVEKYLDKCVESIINQTYKNLEIILVDDGSPDNCPAMCDAWAEKDNRIKVIHKENGGLSDARNAGMNIAIGEYIGFVDSDDYIAPEMYEKLLQSINESGSDISACAVQMVWEDESLTKMLTVQEKIVLDNLEAQKQLLFENKIKQPVWYKLYEADLIKDIPFEKGKIHEDVYWSYQAIAKANKVSLIDYVGYYYIQQKSGIMGSGYSLKRLDAMEAICNRYDFYKKNYPSLVCDAKIRIVENCIYNGQMSLMHLNNDDKKIAFKKLNEYKQTYKLNKNEMNELSVTHKVWIMLSNVSLKPCCKIKNILKVGL